MYKIAVPWPYHIIHLLNALRDSVQHATQAFRFAKDDSDSDDSPLEDDWSDDADSEDLGFDDESFGDDEGDDDDDSDDDSDDDDSDDNSDDTQKAVKTAIIQKQRYRDKLKKAEERLAQYEKKNEDGTATSSDEKERKAEEFLVGKIKDVLSQIEQEQKQNQEAKSEQFNDAVALILDENPSLDEKQLVDLTEELEVSPEQAAKILQREAKLKTRKKPNVPNEKRASTKVKKTQSTDEKKPTSLSDVARRIKSEHNL